ncbi:flagellar motor protein MotA [Xanthobacter sp. YC-JY1]|uniref:flagellar motor protein MotA n=1 Tax=Xanthobacter TaxID=279 RepID=UPI001AC1428E|nr:flagellar motor protein MotA [Xanthobacter sp. YC-JY1]MBN8916331.1 flagellar motor protein MotA [Hyphomicrobiales bacterium]UJX44285.1 flagellar motor protein MotA [Xanthobacter sp. YC-JY1]
MARVVDPFIKLSSPRIFLVRMLVFLALCAALAAVLHRQIVAAFLNNPGLNGVIFGVLAVGIILAIRQVYRLFPEVDWVNSFRLADPGLAVSRPPTLLAPMAALLGERLGRMTISQATMRSILDSIGTRLDESRDMGRYLTGLLVFLGLLGTFWGLLETVSSIGSVIGALQVGPDVGSIFEDMKSGLAAPLGGMGTAFSSSLFGLSGSLVLGFLDLQAGQAQNRFYTDLEDWLSTTVRDLDDGPRDRALAADREAAPRVPAAPAQITPAAPLALPPPVLDLDPLVSAMGRLEKTMTEAGSQRVTTALAQLAESLQGLVTHMRSEQALLKQMIEQQQAQQEQMRRLLSRVEDDAGPRRN